MKKAPKKVKIFIGLSETSGFYGRLYKGLVQIGVTCFFAPIILNKHAYEVDYLKTNIFVQSCQFAFGKRITASNFLLKIIWKVLYEILKVFLFFWAICSFNVFIFSGGECFWGTMDIWIYKILRKKLIFICLGSFTRIPFTDGSFLTGIYSGKEPTPNEIVLKTIRLQKKVDILEKYANVFLNHPAQAQLNKKKFISLCNIGLPLGQMPQKVEKLINTTQVIKILHAPSYLGCRGTVEFRHMIEELKTEGLIFEYIEITGVKNEILMEKIQECDFVLDELYSDTPMATLAMEAAFYGKPTVVAGYFSEIYLKFYEKDMVPPSLYVMPEEAKNAIRKMILDGEFRNQLGKRAEEFVIKNYSGKIVAQKLCNIIKGDFPKYWIVDPEKIKYNYGYGMSKEQIKSVIVNIIKINGRERFCRAGIKNALRIIDQLSPNGDF